MFDRIQNKEKLGYELSQSQEELLLMPLIKIILAHKYYDAKLSNDV